MNKILELGRRALFYVRVLSGYEERRIRKFRHKIENHLQQMQERKAALNKVPEQIILSEVRRMVEDMKALNKKLEETETSIEEYFKPVDMEAEAVMKMQLEGEEKTSKMMMEALEKQALLVQARTEKIASMQQIDQSEISQEDSEIMTKILQGDENRLKEMMETTQKQVLLEKKANAGNTRSVHEADSTHASQIPESTSTHKVS